ncbi:MAG TPA: right-handed parallel beta-helix repeat-containing protein, partial [Candidatus Saccharimonadales bacterium]|nr:right-handed parallel beta-helix repeat-containing protein [Candidatus Saccharimonadales bacterium]
SVLRHLWRKWWGSGLSVRIGIVALLIIIFAAPAAYLGSRAGRPAKGDTTTTQPTKSGTKVPGHTSHTGTTPNSSATTPPSSSKSAGQGTVGQGTTSGTGPGGSAPGGGTASAPAFPDATTTGVPNGVTLHSCPTTITITDTYDACQFLGGLSVRASNVHITRSLITGQVDTGDGGAGEQTGLVISDSTINCGCQSTNDTHTPFAIAYSNFTLLRVNIYNSGHGAAVDSNVVIQDSYIHGLGGNTEAHKDGIYSGNGTNVVIKHNTIECNDGPLAGCTSAIGLLTDFSDITYYTIDNNLLNTNGAYCFYASGGPGKTYDSNHIVFTNNHFGRKYGQQCGDLGPVTYFDSSQPAMVWSGNVWDDTGAAVLPVY